MREIKYRVWDGKMMHYPEWFCFNSVWEFDTNWAAWDGISNRSLKNITSQGESSHLMQYTGLKDKNGVEIFEGDIVVIDASYRDWSGLREVYFSEYGRYMPRNLYTKKDIITVIGNIYKNPELIPA